MMLAQHQFTPDFWSSHLFHPNAVRTYLTALILAAATTQPVLAQTLKKSVTVTRTSVTQGSAPRAGNMPVWSKSVSVPIRAWLPVDKPHEVFLCIHGLGFSGESFREFGRVMAGRGFAVYAMDVRGFGQWIKRKGQDTVDFEACLVDVQSALKTLHGAYPGVPIFLVGESMGGAIAMEATARYPKLVDGLISAVPSSDRYQKLSSEVVVGMHFIRDPDKPINVAPEVINRCTTNTVLREKMKAEPTNHMKLSPKELKQFESFMKGNYDAAHLIEKTPVLMLAGFKDKLVKPEGTIELFNSLSTPDKLLMVVGDGEHLLLEENQLTEQMTTLLVDWAKNEAHSRHPGVTAHP
jgi:acylglycerol lipase